MPDWSVEGSTFTGAHREAFAVCGFGGFSPAELPGYTPAGGGGNHRRKRPRTHPQTRKPRPQSDL